MAAERAGQRSVVAAESEQLNEVEALAEAVLEAGTVAGLGVTVSFDDGIEPRNIYVNDAAARIIGASPEELVGRETLRHFAPEEHQHMRTLIAAWRAGQATPALVESVIARDGGERVPVEAAFSVVTLSGLPTTLSGAPAIVTFLRDISERKAAEKEREILRSHLSLKDRMATLGMLAAGVAHEINNPIAYASLNFEVIVRELRAVSSQSGSSELGVEGPSDAVERAIDAVRDGLARVAIIVRDLKGLSAPKSVERWPVDVKDVLESALNVAMNAIRGRAHIERDYRDVPQLKTDPTKLGQILLNLVFNAVQSFEVPDERNVIRLSIGSSSSREVVVCVADNGPGISPERLARIFEPFFSTKHQGTGLGLSICQTLASALDAKLDVESEMGKGTTFSLRLPSLQLPASF